MPIYKAKIKCFVGQSIREAGEEFEYNGEYCKHLELVSGAETEMPVASTTNTPVDSQVQTSNLELMTKAELEVYGRSIGIELDKRQTKNTLIAQLEEATK